MTSLELGIEGLAPLPEIARDVPRWMALERKLNQRIFFRSEGMKIGIGAPQLLSGELLHTCRQVVSEFDRFYACLVDEYYQDAAGRPDFLVNPLFAPSIEADRSTKRALVASRLDCVLTARGELKVIELNSIAVCLFHLRNTLYLIRALADEWSRALAEQLDTLLRSMVGAFVEHYQNESASPKSRPMIGILAPERTLRVSSGLFCAAFERFGCSAVYGSPKDLASSGGKITLCGRELDVLWADFLFYMAYQFARYRETTFPTKVADYRGAPEATTELLDNRAFTECLKKKSVVLVSAMKSYLALPKHLLSRAHALDRPLPGCDRAWLMKHTARTYSARERTGGGISFDFAVKSKDALLLKPCQYGGSHGVVAGLSMSQEEWSQKVEAIWADMSWVLQDFYEPVCTPSGAMVSVGLYTYGGKLGGMTLRTAPSRIVSARDAMFIPVVSADEMTP